MAFLQKQFAARKVQKTYVAIVKGHMKEAEAIIDMPIGRNMQKPQTFHTVSDGKPAVTRYKVIKELDGYEVLELKPETGRTHQIRVHMQAVGHPIVGDHLYDGDEGDRLYLHAKSLEIALPTGERKIFASPMPVAFKHFETKHHA